MTRPPIADVALAACGAALSALYAVIVLVPSPAWHGVVFFLLHVGLSVALLVRSTHRRASFVATYALLAGMAALMSGTSINFAVSPIILCAPLSLYKVARHDPTAWGVSALLLGIAGAFVSPLNQVPGGASGGLIALMILGMVGTYLWASGRRRTELAHVDALARARAEHEREAGRRVAQAEADERARIAREIHDIVAHSLAVVNVQASTALAVGTEAHMRDSLAGVRDSSKSALGELRSLVSVLRDDGAGVEVSGDLHRLAALVEAARGAGVRLDADLPDEGKIATWQSRWPAPARLAVVRVVQEGLSNVIKHGGPSPDAMLRVIEDGDSDSCRVEIRNDARTQGDSSGFGLPGLRERATLAGGEFDAGPDGAGFLVRARIPVTSKENP